MVIIMRKEIEIQKILKQFYEVSGFRISIHDTEFNEIYAYPQNASPYCSFLQKNPAVLTECENNDKKAFNTVKHSGETYLYQCNKGLYEAVAPIYHYGELSGYLMMGQVCDDTLSNKNYIKKTLLQYTKDEKYIHSLIENIKTVSKDKLDPFIGIMTVIAEYITETNKLYLHNKKLSQLIKEYVDKNFASNITLTILTQKFNCSKSTLTHCFRTEYNSSIIDYLIKVRLDNAIKLLKNSNLSIKEISTKCGFSDQNYFSRMFTQRMKTPPTEFKNSLKKDVF